MGETLTLTSEDGHKFAAYRANPSGTPRGGLISPVLTPELEL